MLCVELVLFDTPYGLKVAPWDDKPLSPEDLKTILDQVTAVNKAASSVVALWAHWETLPSYVPILKHSYYSNDVTPVVWYKDNQNVAGRPDQMTFAWEVFLTGRMKSSSDKNMTTCHLSKNPLQRHNHITGPTLSKYRKNDKQEKINVHEKPTYLSRWLAERFTDPGDWVLVIGAGAGGEVFGCLEHGCNIVAIEKDPVQAKELIAALTIYDVELRQKNVKAAAKRLATTAAEAENTPNPSGWQRDCGTCGYKLKWHDSISHCWACGLASCVKCAYNGRPEVGNVGTDLPACCSEGCMRKMLESVPKDTGIQDKPIKNLANPIAPQANHNPAPPQDDAVAGNAAVASDAESSQVPTSVTSPPPK